MRLRQLAGLKGPVQSTPNKARSRPIKTPVSSARKRKPQKDESESDAEGHRTEDESPTKRKPTQRGGGVRSRGMLGDVEGGGSIKTGIVFFLAPETYITNILQRSRITDSIPILIASLTALLSCGPYWTTLSRATSPPILLHQDPLRV